MSFQKDAAQRFAPSMRQRTDLAQLYSDALDQLDGVDYDDVAPRPWPLTCPFKLDALLTERRATLEAQLDPIAPKR